MSSLASEASGRSWPRITRQDAPAGMVLLGYDLGSCSLTVDYGQLGGHLPSPEERVFSGTTLCEALAGCRSQPR